MDGGKITPGVDAPVDGTAGVAVPAAVLPRDTTTDAVPVLISAT